MNNAERYKRHFAPRAFFPDEEQEKETISAKFIFDPTICNKCGHSFHGRGAGCPNIA